MYCEQESIKEKYFVEIFTKRMEEKQVQFLHVHCALQLDHSFRDNYEMFVVACLKCGRYNAEIQNLNSVKGVVDRSKIQHFRTLLDDHLKHSEALRRYWKDSLSAGLAQRTRAGKTISVFKIEDNMSTVLLPSARVLFHQKKRSYSDFLQLHLGAIQTSSLNPISTYFAYTEAVSNENTNTILTQLSLDLADMLREFPDVEELFSF